MTYDDSDLPFNIDELPVEPQPTLDGKTVYVPQLPDGWQWTLDGNLVKDRARD